jgi:hypothetical protein
VIRVRLEANRPRNFSRGGARIEAFRGVDPADGTDRRTGSRRRRPLFGRERDGLTTLSDGRLLCEAAAADPEHWRFDGVAAVDVGNAVLVVLGRKAALRPLRSAELALERGATIFVPFGAGATVLDGDVDLIRCRPPVGAP